MWERAEKAISEKEREGIEGTKSEGVTPEQSRGPSRRTSILGRSEEPSGWQTDVVGVERVFKEEDLELEKEKTALRAT